MTTLVILELIRFRFIVFDNVRPITTANFGGEFYNEDSWSGSLWWYWV